MPVHDWTRVSDGIFHDFHYSWVLEIKRALRRGLLPKGYYVMVESIGGELDAPDALMGIASDSYSQLQRAVVVRHTGYDSMVSRIEILSPGNKSSRRDIQSFLVRASTALKRGIHLLLVDVHPPGSFDPNGIQGALLDEIRIEEYVIDRMHSLTLGAYAAGSAIEAYIDHFSLGDPIPEMPLFLTNESYVPVPLETTYLAAWEDVPPRYQELLE